MAATVNVHGKFLDAGLPAQGVVTFSDLSFSVDSVNGVVNTPVKIDAYLDQNGEFFTSLPLNVGVGSTPQPRSYHCTVAVQGTALDFDFVLTPAALSVEFSDIVPVGQVPSLPAQYVASIGGMSGVITYNDFVAAFPSLAPTAGKSAYQLWLDNGHTGSLDDFFAALRGLQGIQGPAGAQGDAGPQGERGQRGGVGPTGRAFHVDVIVAGPSNLTAGGGAVGSDGQTTLFPKDTIAATLSSKEFWYFDGVEWHNLGSYQGPQGPAGATATKASVGLGNVANLAPADLPISNATQLALNQIAANVGKVQSVNGQTGDVFIGAADVGLGNVPNFTAAQWPFSDALTTRLGQVDAATAAKWTRPAGGSAATFLRGDDAWVGLTSADVGLGKVRNYASMDVLDSTTNLDNLLTTGDYHQPLTANASLANNYPVARAGFLEVKANVSGQRMVVQIYRIYGFGSQFPTTYARATYDVQSWTVWRQMYVSGIDDLTGIALHNTAGHGLTNGGTFAARSLVPGGAYPDSYLDNSTLALAYPLAPSAATSWTGFPQGISYWRLSSGVNGSPTDYPLLSGTLVMNRNTYYPRQELRSSQSPSFTRYHVAGVWQPWTPIEQEMAVGRFVTSLTANTIKTVAVTFPPGRFSTVPEVQLTAVTTVPDRVRGGVSDVTTDGFNAYCWRNTDSNTTFSWMAIATP